MEVLHNLLGLLQSLLQPGGRALIYWVPMLILPAALALLVCPNPIEQSRHLRPTVWKLLLTVACVVGSVLLFSGVTTFIYANF